MWKSRFVIFVFVLIASVSVTNLSSQTKKKPSMATRPTPPVTPNKEEPKEQPPPIEPITKRNERPNGNGFQAVPSPTPTLRSDPYYTYEFTQPEFVNKRILIEHDDRGTGRFSFTRRGSEEVITDPLQISSAAMERIKGAYTRVEFSRFNRELSVRKRFFALGRHQDLNDERWPRAGCDVQLYSEQKR
jgi:hypothetical protein